MRSFPRSVVVEPVTTQNPGLYVARVVSDIFERAGENYCRLPEAPQSSLRKIKARIGLRGLTMKIREYLSKKVESREFLGEKGIFGKF
jgi:hypothetical protein